MVELDIREDGEAVSLGDITVNGHASTAAQLMKIAQLQSTLEIIRLMDKDVEVTDEHIANLESLLQGISDGSVDIDSALGSGAVSVTQRLAGSGTSGGFPETKTGEGTVCANTNGEYTAHYISGSEYEASHTFTLADPANNTYFTDSRYDGVQTDGVITLSCADTAVEGNTVTVTASLEKALELPVSFDWSVGGGAFSFANSGGTVSIPAGDTQATFTFPSCLSLL
ncbi:MAG: hypothetical protein K6B74_11905 [Ruminococcus sp.]|nr:hypothetical protein [Ruminococcus sp.]